MDCYQSINDLMNKAVNKNNQQLITGLGECLSLLSDIDRVHDPSVVAEQIKGIILEQKTLELQEELRSLVLEVCHVVTGSFVNLSTARREK